MLRKAGKGYVLGVPQSCCSVRGARRSWSEARREDRSKSSRALGGAVGGRRNKGPRLHDWAYLELADLDASEYNSASPESGRGVC